MATTKTVRQSVNLKDDRETQIVGIRMPPALAQEFKMEAARRGITLAVLFAELWKNYKHRS
jgi:hypothetical protein